MAGVKGRCGRKRKPDALKIIHGTFRNDRAKAALPPAAAPGTPRPPKFLGKLARAEWRRLAPDLAAAGVLTRGDRAGFAAYCQAFGRWVEAEELLKAGPDAWLHTTPSGLVRTSALLAVADSSMARMAKLATEFGLTPSSRSSIGGITPPDPKNGKSKKDKPILDRNGNPA